MKTWLVEKNYETPQVPKLLHPRGSSPFAADPGNVAKDTPSKVQSSFSSPTLIAGGTTMSELISPAPPPNGNLSTPTSNRLAVRVSSFNGLGVVDTPPKSTADPPSDSGEGEDSSPWSSAVGKASLGKSGRVIERLMGDIDKLKRELNSATHKKQEAVKREEATKAAIEVLRTENSNLKHTSEIDATMLKRRDRKIEQLKAELEAEQNRRQAVEKSSQLVSRERDDAIAQRYQEVSKATEIAKHATSHAEVLEQSHKQLSTEYRQRTEVVQRDFRKLMEERDEERQTVKRLDVIVEQMRQEIARSQRANSQLVETFEAYREASNRRMEHLKAQVDAQEAEDKSLRAEVERVVGEARWLINVGKNTRDRQLKEQQPEQQQ